LLSPIFEDDELAFLAKQFVTCLVRVPEAYSLVSKYKTVRPGFLVLKPDGAKWGSVSLSAMDPDGSGQKAIAYLKDALDAENPVADQHEYPESDPSLLTGSIEVAAVEEGSTAEKAGFKKGDVLLRINSQSIEKFFDVDLELLKGKKNTKTEFELSRDGHTIKIIQIGPLDGISWIFRGKSQN
jgi:membrane-associated protease RseP (regulator of RpoE activity)